MDGLSLLALAAETVQRYEKSAPDFTIRRARYTDVPQLGPVERSAAELFRSANLDFLLDGPTVDQTFLVAMINANHLWVAVDRMDDPIGFVGGENIEGNFHIVEISVARLFQGKGVGRALMTRMTEDIRREGYNAITLTTYRDLDWNGRWYTRMGFLEMNVESMGPDYWKIWQIEARHGFNMASRCLMRKII